MFASLQWSKANGWCACVYVCVCVFVCLSVYVCLVCVCDCISVCVNCHCVLSLFEGHCLLSGETGRFIYQVGFSKNVINYAQKCDDWYNNQDQQALASQMASIQPCPCDLRQAKGDKRWKKDTDVTDMECFYQRHVLLTNATQV